MKKAVIYIVILFIAAGISVRYLNDAFAASGTSVQATVRVSSCGNTIVEDGESCDGANFAGLSCSNYGFASGILSCNSSCGVILSGCSSPVNSGGGGGGGGGGATVYIPEAKITFSGRAYPGMKVTVLKDAQVVASTVSDPAANFKVTVSGLSAGSYIFGIYSEDKEGRRSALLTYPASLTSGVSIDIGDIFITPTIAVDKSEVKQGDNIVIFGQSVPRAEVTISVNSPKEFFERTFADAGGSYLLNFDTSRLEIGQHFTKSKSAVGGTISSFGNIIGFAVGDKNVLTQKTACMKADLNCNGRVNLVDFSIMAYWFKRTAPPEIDLNEDGNVDIADFSIMAYYWTG